jgi:hypothetical protein
MTNITLRFNRAQVPVAVQGFKATAESGNDELQHQINQLVDLVPVKPVVNGEPWLARLLIDHFTGRIIDEPEFDPDAGDVTAEPDEGGEE